MCGYDPFYWYEKELDEEYIEQMKKELDDVEISEGTDEAYEKLINDPSLDGLPKW